MMPTHRCQPARCPSQQDNDHEMSGDSPADSNSSSARQEVQMSEIEEMPSHQAGRRMVQQ